MSESEWYKCNERMVEVTGNGGNASRRFDMYSVLKGYVVE